MEIVDRDFDVSRKRADGGNGKTVLIKSLANIMNVTELMAKSLKKDAATLLPSRMSPYIRKSVFDDAERSLTPLVSSLALQVISMCAVCCQIFSIKASDAPKIVITSNYPLGETTTPRGVVSLLLRLAVF